MPSSSLAPYKNATVAITYGAVGSSPVASKWSVSGYGLGTPRTLEQTLKVGAPGATGNDHVILRLSQSDENSTTSKIATANVTLDISIPRDNSTVTTDEIIELLGILASLLNDQAVVENAADAVNRKALAEGRML